MFYFGCSGEFFSPLLPATGICTTIIIFLLWTRVFISSNELQYLHCSLNIWRIVSCPMLIRHIGKHFMLGLSPMLHSVTSRETEHAQRGLGTRLATSSVDLTIHLCLSHCVTQWKAIPMLVLRLGFLYMLYTYVHLTSCPCHNELAPGWHMSCCI